jgi:esterase/lipase
MRNRLLKLTTLILILLIGIGLGIFLRQNKTTWSLIKKPFVESFIKFDDTRQAEWSKDFEIIEIESSIDKSVQKSYSYKSKSKEPKPLIVSLHTWSGYYNQNDDLAEICKQKDLNYIHPDFRGANITIDACCSELALADIDDAITYAIRNSNVDTTKIYVIGVSGGGYATLSAFMKSKHNIKKFSAWASITDLIAWHNESNIRNNNYAENILDCTGSKDGLNTENAKQKSPIYWNTPTGKIKNSKLFIYAGIYDGIQGSVPISHSINFYNKLLTDLSVTDTLKYVSTSETLKLLEKRKPLGEFGSIAGRKICLKKEFENVSLIIFEGNHEMLTEFALNELLEE